MKLHDENWMKTQTRNSHNRAINAAQTIVFKVSQDGNLSTKKSVIATINAHLENAKRKPKTKPVKVMER